MVVALFRQPELKFPEAVRSSLAQADGENGDGIPPPYVWANFDIKKKK